MKYVLLFGLLTNQNGVAVSSTPPFESELSCRVAAVSWQTEVTTAIVNGVLRAEIKSIAKCVPLQ